ncbi:MAG: bifunctional methylenetetrahydrofolate dehydrogenase/methenyltetrahydrofolate cyclohydrolase FolD [Deltaproteobacteria bacterium]|nr:bifunctional methylenetetrahydrofolate dehydrogenase/methenyltetrahydrofolate cyclohydrolase FolD [Deltaproteobacteria bacterium]
MRCKLAKIIDGKSLARTIRNELKREIEILKPQLGRAPGLAVVLVGDDPASYIYVGNKEKAAAEIGMAGQVIRMPATASLSEIIASVDKLNADDSVDGMIVQMPLPPGLDEASVLNRIDPNKDADGLHPMNLGRLVAGMPGPRSCTPAGVMRLIDTTGIELKGAKAVVIGRSEMVGKPMAHLLLERHATVTICHSRTKDLADEVHRADIVVAAVGRPELVRGEWIKEGAVVIDVGTTRVEGKLKGDVEFDQAATRASAITPVPGGVGPMTIAMLLANTVAIAKQKLL